LAIVGCGEQCEVWIHLGLDGWHRCVERITGI